MKKKVLHVITGLGLGGAETSLYNLCKLDQNKHVVVSLVGDGYFKEKLEVAGVEVYALSIGSVGGFCRGFIELCRIIDHTKPDVMQTWMYHANLYGGAAAYLMGIKDLYWNVRHSSIGSGHTSKKTFLVAKLGAFLSGWVPRGIVALSHRAARSHLAHGYSAKKIKVISNGVDCNKFRPFDGELSEELPRFGADTFILGMAARFTPEKDHDTFLRSLAGVFRETTNTHALIVGSGVVEGLIDKVASYGIEERVTLLEHVENMPALMNLLNLHVLTSKSEGFGNVIIESLACGTPCVSTDVGDAEMIMGPEWIVPVGDSIALKNKIVSLVSLYESDASIWRGMRSSARAKSTKYSMEAAVMAYNHLWFGLDNH